MVHDEGVFGFPKSVVLNLHDFAQTMLFDWAGCLVNTSWIEGVRKEAVIVHFTMLDDPVKPLMAKHFGLWLDENYYLNPPKLLHPINIRGNKSQIASQILFADDIARRTNRTFMWPLTVHEYGPKINGTVATLRSLTIETITNVSTTAVEGTYLKNRKAFTSDELSQFGIVSPRNLSHFESTMGLVEVIRSSNIDLITVDFEKVEDPRWNKPKAVKKGN